MIVSKSTANEGMRIDIINGPNLGHLGHREPAIYGSVSWADCFASLRNEFTAIELSSYQSNHEGELIERIYWASDHCDALIVNLAGYSHSSVALHDALKACAIPFVEVHISNIYRREAFRHHSLTAPLASGLIIGLGIEGYRLAVLACQHIHSKN